MQAEIDDFEDPESPSNPSQNPKKMKDSTRQGTIACIIFAAVIFLVGVKKFLEKGKISEENEPSFS